MIISGSPTLFCLISLGYARDDTSGTTPVCHFDRKTKSGVEKSAGTASYRHYARDDMPVHLYI